MTPSKASTKASSQQSASAAEAAKEELASVRREAAAAKEASAAELSLMRRQLASAQSAAADAEAALAEAEKVPSQNICALELYNDCSGLYILCIKSSLQLLQLFQKQRVVCEAGVTGCRSAQPRTKEKNTRCQRQ